MASITRKSSGRARKGTLVSITGNTGAGTTTLTMRLAELAAYKPIYAERCIERSPFFHRFLKDPVRWAFQNQVFFIVEYIDAYRSATERSLSTAKIVCLDYSIHELAVYSAAMQDVGYLSSTEHRTIGRILKLLEPSMRIPDLLIYVQAKTETVMDRIRERSRPGELGIARDYAEALRDNFEQFVAHWDKCPVLVFESEKADFLHRDDHVKALVGQIRSIMKDKAPNDAGIPS